MAKTAFQSLSSVKNLQDVWKEYKTKIRNSAAGVDAVTFQNFNDEANIRLAALSKSLQNGYNFSALRGVAVPKKDPTKFRVICIPTIQDRIVQRCVLKVIESKGIKLGIVNDVSFGFVKDNNGRKRGAPAARDAAIRHRQLKPWAFKADISAFFDKIQRDDLIFRFRKSFSLKSLTPIVEKAIRCEVDSSDERIRRILAANEIVRGQGLRQGMPLSPILSNFLLRDFDKAFVKRGYDLVRYADDLLVLAHSRSECEEIQDFTQAELFKLGLSLSPTKTEIRSPTESVEFLGMELGLNLNKSKYILTISKKQIEKIHEQFKLLHDIDRVVGMDLNIIGLGKRLASMSAGYRVAYGVADNYHELDQRISQYSINCVHKLYASIFGSSAIDKLTQRQKLFLKIE
jgi:RNA-directed DNA polymerase